MPQEWTSNSDYRLVARSYYAATGELQGETGSRAETWRTRTPKNGAQPAAVGGTHNPKEEGNKCGGPSLPLVQSSIGTVSKGQ